MTPIDRALAIVTNAVGPRGGDVDIEASALTTRGWDSIAHVNILMEIERETGTTVPAAMLATLTSVAAIAAFLEKAGVPGSAAQ
ncbi:MAG: acyl carrier protein [Pseudomonadota bacterium]